MVDFTPVSLLASHNFLFSVAGSKLFSFPTFALNPHNKLPCDSYKTDSYFYLQLVYIQNNNITSAAS
jgi:hypothetical protein